jgi:hypothetical protein
MIKFIPHTLPLPEKIGLGSANKLIQNKSNSAIAAQLNNRFEDKCCEEHPSFENAIIVDLSEGDNFLTLETYCCNTFKKKLDLVIQNKDPFMKVW